MDLQLLNPLEIPNWDVLLLRSGDQSIFHTALWASVLIKTYGYRPIYIASFEGGLFSFLMPIMEVVSPFTGKRGVSLPFSDQCPPHVLRDECLQAGLQHAKVCGEENGWRYLELRDNRYCTEGITAWETFFIHNVDLNNTESELFASLADGNRRSIRKSIKEGVTIKKEQSFNSLKSFYRLHCITRKRHGLPPQPFTFFKNIFSLIISRGLGTIISADYAGKTIAASVYFHFGQEVLYKYGASEIACQHLRPNNQIMWEALRWYSQQGYKNMNLGRTSLENQGLLRYKRNWGAKEYQIYYTKFDIKNRTYIQERRGLGNIPTKLLARLPISVLRIIGRLAYKHIG